MYTGRYPTGYADVMTELEKGPQGRRRGRGARERILSASQQLFRDQGINRTGMDQLCAAAQVSKRTAYQHFTGKDELVAEYLRRFDPDVTGGVFDRTDLTPANDSSLPSKSPRPGHRTSRQCAPTSRRPSKSTILSTRTPVRTRLQESLCRAVRRNRPRSRRHQPRTARRATGTAPRWRLGPHPGPHTESFPTAAAIAAVLINNAIPRQPPAMTAEVSRLRLCGWQVSGSPVRPRRPGRGRPWRGHGSGPSGVVSSTSTSGSPARSAASLPRWTNRGTCT